MRKLRARFEKKDRAKYISHLDLYRFMQRTFKKAGVSVWYTEGFNPRLYIMFPLALSLGYEGRCEVMDFNVNDENMPLELIKEKLNTVLPDGIRIKEIYDFDMKHTLIAFSEYEIRISKENVNISKEKFEEFMSQDEIVIQKKTKQKTMKDVDIKPFSNIKEIMDEDELFIKIVMPSSQNGGYNPSLLLDAFFKFIDFEPETVHIVRTDILTEKGESFR